MILKEAFQLLSERENVQRNTVQHGPYSDLKAAQKKAQNLTAKGFSGVSVQKSGQGVWLITATKPKGTKQQ